MTDSNFANLQGMDAQAAEDRDKVAGALGSEAPFVAGGSSENPGGSTGTGGATDNTRTEQAGEGTPPAVEGTAGIEGGAGPSDTGGGGGGAVVSGQPAAAPGNEPTAPQSTVQTNPITTGGLPAIPAAAPGQATLPEPTQEPTATNIPPLDLDETQTIYEDGVATGNVLLNVEDPDGGPAVVTQFTIPGDPGSDGHNR
jgi:hypothetical protein